MTPTALRGFLPLRLRRGLAVVLAALGVGLALVPAAPVWAAPSHADVDRHVLDAAQLQQSARVILVARGDLGTVRADLRRAGVTSTVDVPIAHGVSAELSPALIERFTSDSNVARIIYDAPVQLTDTPFNPVTLATVYPGVVGATGVLTDEEGGAGRGVGIAVIDSGIAQHPDLQTRVIVSRNFNPNVSGTDDPYGHGTAVAGIIGGNGASSGGRYIGIAPAANLINLRVNDGTGSAPTSAIMNAVLWAVQHKNDYNIRVMNLSMLASVAESYRTSPIDAAVEYAWLKGIVVVVAAGNRGRDSMLYAPANDPYVITVGATDDRGTLSTSDDTLASFSSYGVTQDGFGKPDLVAPGRHIITTLASGSAFALNHPTHLVDSGYIQLSGTSVAAPIVSGVAALYLEAHPWIGPGQLKSVLLGTANPLAIPGSGAGYPDVHRAREREGYLGDANRGLQPNNYLQALYLAAQHLTTLPVVSWDSVSWDSVSWDSVSWDTVSWSSVSWDSVSWDSVSWSN
jgi:serine protease AprX